MKPPVTSEAFWKLVRYSGLVDARSLDDFVRRHRAARPLPNDPENLARRMVRSGLLSYFQAAQLLRGKYQGFVLGTYLLLERLGSGSSRNLFLAVDMVLRRRIAIEILTAPPAQDPMFPVDPEHDARVADLDHPNLVRAYGAEQVENLCLRLWEYVDGTSLQDIVQERGPLGALRAAHYVRQAAEGLQYLHEAGFIHRGISPSNLLLDRRGTVKLLGAGLPHLVSEPGTPPVAAEGDPAILVTAAYRAPDQPPDRALDDIRSDIYSLGATWFFLLTGRLPCAEDLADRTPPANPRHDGEPADGSVSNLPQTVRAVLVQMMAPDSAQRFATPSAVADALAEYTQTPPPPPTEEELPRLSPLALRGWSLACQRVQAASGLQAGPVGPGADLAEMLGAGKGPTAPVPDEGADIPAASTQAPPSVSSERGTKASAAPPRPPQSAGDGEAGSVRPAKTAGGPRQAPAGPAADDPLPGEIPTHREQAPKRKRRPAAPVVQAPSGPPVPGPVRAAARRIKQAWAAVPPIRLPAAATRLLARAKQARGSQSAVTAAVLLGVLVLCASAVGIIVSGSKNGKEETPAFQMNGEQLLHEFLSNEVAATVKYMGKTMEVQGVVYDVDSDGVQLQVGKATRGKVYCDPAEDVPQDFSGLKKGDKLVARGVCGGATASIPGVRMVKCEFRRP
jgi:serine/threonine protein kinase